jgi:ring-1,2-phenylacetyl-CoA epoxidase subunit PaaE
MSALKFYSLKVNDVRPETADCVSVSLEVPAELAETFRFAPGQYLTFRRHFDDAEVRRSYSICASPRDGELRVAIKRVEEGKFSTYAHSDLKAGDVLDVMPPMGRFTPRKTDTGHKEFLAFAYHEHYENGAGGRPRQQLYTCIRQPLPHQHHFPRGNRGAEE